MHALISDKKLNNQRVFFGGVYKECWTEDYRLSICYEGRKFVDANLCDGKWSAVSGDREIIEALAAGESCMSLYFQAAAQVAKTIAACKKAGLKLEILPEGFELVGNPLYAAELVRSLMDDHGLSFETAYDVAAQCCKALDSEGIDLEQMYAVQPRTAHIISILRQTAAEKLTVYYSSLSSQCRSPYGAVRCEEDVTLSFKLLGGRVKKACLRLWGDDFCCEYPMQQEGDRFVVHFAAPEKAQALWYSFRIEHDLGCSWICPKANGYGGRLCGMMEGGFRLTVYLKDFETPKWFRESIMYQVFPDRFAFSQDDTAKNGIAYHEKLGQSPELHGSIDEPVRHLPRSFEKDYSPDDFYGGTFKGIEEKLPYLKELGINCLYLNPIVEARSNHRYDASDYLKPDPILGSLDDFDSLCKKAESMGIRLMLDGVFSHTGADSIYFNRYGNYRSVGACQGQESHYYKWYDFKEFPNDYRSWWGFKDLPEVNELDASWQDYVVSGENSVVKTWLHRGASGWRLDVADELPDEVLSLIREHSKAVKPDAPILGEVWEDAVIKESYGGRRNYALGHSLDSVMNYPFRNAMLDFAHGRITAYGLRDFLICQQMNYPQPMYCALMNLLGSHDTDRVLTAMSTPVVLRCLSRKKQLSFKFSEERIARAKELEKLCAAIQFSIPGVPCIYYGDEQGMQGVNDPFNRLPFKEGDGELHAYYSMLCAMRKQNPAFLSGKAEFAAVSDDLLLIFRSSEDESSDWLVAVNRADKEKSFSFCHNGKHLSGTASACTASYIEIEKG